MPNLRLCFWKAVTLIHYIVVLIQHKWLILWTGLRLNGELKSKRWRVSMRRLLAHDLSKLSPSELIPSAVHYYSYHYKLRFPVTEKEKQRDKEAYQAAWRHHYTNNDHHSEYFHPAYNPSCKSLDGPLRMEKGALLELVADWYAAQRAYDGNWPEPDWPWVKSYSKNWESHFHPVTLGQLWALLCILGFEKAIQEGNGVHSWESARISMKTKQDKDDFAELERIYAARNKKKH